MRCTLVSERTWQTVLSLLMVLSTSACSLISGPPSAEYEQIHEMKARYQAQEPRSSLYVPSQPVRRLPEPKLEVTAEVKRQMRVYGGHQARHIQQSLQNRDEFYPMLAQVFSDEGVPETLLNLALVESGFRTEARSPAGAVGMWQFMKSTARLYGLKVGLFVDERQDPILSTIAAARLLRDLYDQYQDWHLALAAYNAGTGAIDRALARVRDRDFWTLARSGRLNRQTAEFVPKFIAASLLMNSAVAEREKTERFASNREILK